MSTEENESATDARLAAASTALDGPLLESLRVGNLKSLRGQHDIPLAPLTLIYGPNAAGKSTILQALRIFMNAVRAGRRDALNPYWECFQKPGTPGLHALISDHDLGRELSLGVRLPVKKTAAAATASLGFGLSSHDLDWWQYSEIGVGDGSPHRKDTNFSVRSPEDLEPLCCVDGKVVRGDHELFAGSLHDVEDRLFDLASLLVHLGPHRGDPPRSFEPGRGPFRRDIGNKDAADPARVNERLAAMEVPYQFRIVDPGHGGFRFRPDWQLFDARTNVDVDLDQVGYGVSQLLPIVEACMRSSDQLICIEQPELHLHPRLQSRLGGLFALAAREGNQIIAETHSENILLRVRRLVRQRKFHHDDVAVLYVHNIDGHGAQVRRLRLGERGQLLDPWPTGFFDDRLVDVLGVAE